MRSHADPGPTGAARAGTGSCSRRASSPELGDGLLRYAHFFFFPAFRSTLSAWGTDAQIGLVFGAASWRTPERPFMGIVSAGTPRVFALGVAWCPGAGASCSRPFSWASCFTRMLVGLYPGETSTPRHLRGDIAPLGPGTAIGITATMAGQLFGGHSRSGCSTAALPWNGGGLAGLLGRSPTIRTSTAVPPRRWSARWRSSSPAS